MKGIKIIAECKRSGHDGFVDNLLSGRMDCPEHYISNQTFRHCWSHVILVRQTYLRYGGYTTINLLDLGKFDHINQNQTVHSHSDHNFF